MSDSTTVEQLIAAAREMADAVDRLRFKPPVTHVYNPLHYAWPIHEQYIRRFATHPVRVLFLGMNPGPFGMVQTGIPFGEVKAVRDWMGLSGTVSRPAREHPKRPITGLDCPRSEVSGQRLWKLFAERFGSPEAFFAEHFVVNYCPLAFCEESGANRTPDKLPASETDKLYKICDTHLRKVVAALQPEWVIGVGAFARERAGTVCDGTPVHIGQILHPSPASPLANRDWAGTATRQLRELGVWK